MLEVTTEDLDTWRIKRQTRCWQMPPDSPLKAAVQPEAVGGGWCGARPALKSMSAEAWLPDEAAARTWEQQNSPALCAWRRWNTMTVDTESKLGGRAETRRAAVLSCGGTRVAAFASGGRLAAAEPLRRAARWGLVSIRGGAAAQALQERLRDRLARGVVGQRNALQGHDRHPQAGDIEGLHDAAVEARQLSSKLGRAALPTDPRKLVEGEGGVRRAVEGDDLLPQHRDINALALPFGMASSASRCFLSKCDGRFACGWWQKAQALPLAHCPDA
eukprot:CAMPEP_0176235500 /NCGR_PEP_ID=MMETSP0121_2-20121125/26869_1 /TAXON_ID=160619 /ORGANISM="Kryptoperidinium foliaceum, Strain CCMP 1326" /LENGTH=273 /DNA_ID=CAMNT_0017574921 /DNA_START=315 /DNA_END=1132 /DNA_ORIENTATION=+